MITAREHTIPNPLQKARSLHAIRSYESYSILNRLSHKSTSFKFCSPAVLHFFQAIFNSNIGSSSATGKRKSLISLFNNEVTKATMVKQQDESLALRMAIFLAKQVNAS